MSLIYKSVVVIILTTHSARCGLLTGDMKFKLRPVNIKSHHAPINININTDKLKAALPSLSLPKPAKPPPLKSLSDLLAPPSKSAFPELSSLFPSKKSNLFKPPSLTESLFPSKSNKLFPSAFSKPSFPSITSLELPKLPSLHKSFLPSPRLSPLSKLSAPIIPKVLPPVIPKVPLLPLPLLPIPPPFPFIPLIPPILPGVFIPKIPSLSPLKVPILGKKSLLQQALGSELKPVLAECEDTGKKILLGKKLRNLLKRGSLTTAEFNRFRRILVG